MKKYIKHIIFPVISGFLVGCSTTTGYYGSSTNLLRAPINNNELVIDYCSGGDVNITKASFAEFEKNNVSVKLNGYIMSACTLAINYSNVCYTEKTIFVFHGVSVNGEYNEFFSKMFVNYFSSDVKEYLKKNDAVKSVEHHFIIDAKTMDELTGGTKKCK